MKFICQEPPVKDGRHEGPKAQLAIPYIWWFLSTLKFHRLIVVSEANHPSKNGGISWFKKELLILGLFILILTSCQSTEQPTETENQTPESITEAPLPINQTAGLCSPGWKCISSDYKAYLLENCSWGNKTKCLDKCLDDKCSAAEACTPGWRCKDNKTKIFRGDWCEEIKKEICKWSCKAGLCLPAPPGTLTSQTDNVSSNGENTSSETAPAQTVFTLVLGETDLIKANNLEHNISIYNLEADQVKIQLDNWKSDWLREGDNYTYGVGMTISIKEILFQAYPGGKKSVGYIVR